MSDSNFDETRSNASQRSHNANRPHSERHARQAARLADQERISAALQADLTALRAEVADYRFLQARAATLEQVNERLQTENINLRVENATLVHSLARSQATVANLADLRLQPAAAAPASTARPDPPPPDRTDAQGPARTSNGSSSSRGRVLDEGHQPSAPRSRLEGRFAPSSRERGQGSSSSPASQDRRAGPGRGQSTSSSPSEQAQGYRQEGPPRSRGPPRR